MSTSDYFLKGSTGQIKSEFKAETFSTTADHETRSVAFSVSNSTGEASFSTKMPLHDAFSFACAILEKIRELEEPKETGGK